MSYEGFESACDNFGKFIHKFQPETKTLIRKLGRILIKLYRQNLSTTYLIKRVSARAHTHTHNYTLISEKIKVWFLREGIIYGCKEKHGFRYWNFFFLVFCSRYIFYLEISKNVYFFQGLFLKKTEKCGYI